MKNKASDEISKTVVENKHTTDPHAATWPTDAVTQILRSAAERELDKLSKTGIEGMSEKGLFIIGFTQINEQLRVLSTYRKLAKIATIFGVPFLVSLTIYVITQLLRIYFGVPSPP